MHVRSKLSGQSNRIALVIMKLASLGLRLHAAMQQYAWPGNLRELRNVVEHAVIFASGNRIEMSDLPEQLNQEGQAGPRSDVRVGMKIPLEELETEHIRRVLAQSSTMEEAAQVLGISRGTLYERKKKLNL